MFYMICVMGCTSMAVLGAAVGADSLTLTCLGLALAGLTVWAVR